MGILAKYMAMAKKVYPRNDYILLRKCLFTIEKQTEKWNVNLRLGKYGEDIIYDELKDIGYIIAKFDMKEEGKITVARKIEKSKESRFPDAFAFYVEKDEPFFDTWLFLDPKTKTKHKWLGIVNSDDYDGYWKFLRYGTVQAPFKLFYYIKETKKIYYHALRDPIQEPKLETTKKWLNRDYVYDLSQVNELTFWKKKD